MIRIGAREGVEERGALGPTQVTRRLSFFPSHRSKRVRAPAPGGIAIFSLSIFNIRVDHRFLGGPGTTGPPYGSAIAPWWFILIEMFTTALDSR